jgi:signal transduction histidine kinase
VNASHAIQSRYGENGSNGSGKITIETENSHSGIVVKIRDNGCGIDSDKVDRIFDPFFTTKPVGKGTGQGLAISHSIVTEKHQGELQVDSIKGEGTTIIVSLPQG